MYYEKDDSCGAGHASRHARHSRYRHDNVRSRVTETKAAINRFTYGFFATLGVNDGCFFFKYYPKSSPLLPDGSVDLSFMTVGVAFGF